MKARLTVGLIILLCLVAAFLWFFPGPRFRLMAFVSQERFHENRPTSYWLRAVSDGATFAYLADVYVRDDWRGRGLGLELVREIVDGGPQWDVRWVLNTADAQALYAKLGFTESPPQYPLMERSRAARGARRG